MNHRRDQILSKWQDRISLVPSAYRWLALGIASAQIFLFPSGYYSLTPPIYLIVAVGIYTLLKTLRPLRWQQKSSTTLILLGQEVAQFGEEELGGEEGIEQVSANYINPR
ncbi:MAG: hypothetical protein GH159_00790 [Dehalococcoidia bacterium]|nr:hypothetical protein [Dehalococcoidia bacterium]